MNELTAPTGPQLALTINLIAFQQQQELSYRPNSARLLGQLTSSRS